MVSGPAPVLVIPLIVEFPFVALRWPATPGSLAVRGVPGPGGPAGRADGPGFASLVRSAGLVAADYLFQQGLFGLPGCGRGCCHEHARGLGPLHDAGDLVVTV